MDKVRFLLMASLCGCATETVSETRQEVSGRQFFEEPLPHTNGRSCATCHIEADHFALTPQHVASAPPGDPLFHPIDADDPTATTPTFAHLAAGLVRVTLRLADNVDEIDAAGNVITNADRTIFVWRGVPSIENVALTAPYQYDGREATLEAQALGALQAHSQVAPSPPAAKLSLIAAFERSVTSGPSALDMTFPAGSDEAEGKIVFQNICAKCHGGPTTHQVLDQRVFDSLFPFQHPDGTIDITAVSPLGVAITDHFIENVSREHMGTIGISAIKVLTLLGVFPNPSGLDFPKYRFRFYTDATRTTVNRDMPPPLPLIGPSLFPEPFTVDPGRAVISGDPIDWEGFDVPQIKGIAHTAPYFHDNSAPDLQTLVDIYSRLILPVDPVLELPAIFPPEGPGLPPESITPTQKRQLLAFLALL